MSWVIKGKRRLGERWYYLTKGSHWQLWWKDPEVIKFETETDARSKAVEIRMFEDGWHDDAVLEVVEV